MKKILLKNILPIVFLFGIKCFVYSQIKVNATGIFNTICKAPNTGKIELNVMGGTPPITFLWQDGNTTATRENLKAGVYNVTATDSKNQIAIEKYEIVPQTPMTFNSELVWKCYGDKPHKFDALYPLPYSLKNALYPVSIYSRDYQTNSFMFQGVFDSGDFRSPVTKDFYHVIIDARQCSLIYNPPVPKWDVSNFSIETTPSFNKYYYDIGEEFNFTASISISKDSIVDYGWTTQIGGFGNNVDSCKKCENYKSTPNGKTAYIFYAIDNHGCERWNWMFIYPKPPPIIPPSTKVFLPTAFSPNDDGYNDQLTLYGAEGVEKVVWMRVFDPWGNLIFEQKDFPAGDNHYGWDGTYKGIAANIGVYTCTYRILLKDGTERTLNNSVSLMR